MIVDDDELFMGALSKTLEREGFKVTPISHGKKAMELIELQDFDVIISDINMAGVSGLDLLEFCSTRKPGLPVILMTGFAELQETATAHERGAKGFLPKPFKKEELFSVIKDVTEEQAKKATEQNTDLHYCKISIDDFVSGHEIQHDIYIRLSEGKYVKIAHQGEDIPIERIRAYKEKNIQFLYMQMDDFRKYLGFNTTLLPLVNAKSSIPLSKKRSFLKHTSEILLEYVHTKGMDEESFQNARSVVESAASLLTAPDDMMNLLLTLNNHTDHLYAHCVGVSMYGVMIARQMQWESQANIFKIAMGGLLHDIGKKEIDRSILEKPRKDLTPEEVRIYETHPYRGMEILSRIATVHSDVLQIALQHHENCLGLGFPLKISKIRIHPMARLIAVADEFCSLALKSGSEEPLAPTVALHRMATLGSGKFDLTFLGALMRIFKMPVPDYFPKEEKQ